MVDTTQTLNAARRLKTAMTFVIIAVLGMVVAAAFFGSADHDDLVRTVTDLPGWDGPPLTQWQEVAVAAIAFVHLGYWLALLLLARGIFGLLSSGDLDGAAKRARTLSFVLWALLVWSVAADALASLAITWHLPEGERVLSISLGTSQVSLALAALISGFLAQGFVLCAELWRDHKEVI
ncbi:MAG: hypothetical protein AAF337_15720 [Pseudomonadota bacterium]